MTTYFKHIPLDLINLIVPLLNDPKSFDEALTSEDIEIKNKHWEIIFSYKFPKMHSKIKAVMKIDPTLRTPRYSKNWKELYLEFLKILDFRGEFVVELYTEERIQEVINLIYAIDLYAEFPQFYQRSIDIPIFFVKEVLYNNLAETYHEILDKDIANSDFIEYFNSGKLMKYIQLNQMMYIGDLSLEVILFMIQDFPKIIEGN